ncbi:MAG: hypothetical protein C0506_07205, partial [Anaerolinea sp.]|nr:hypothetical protein [Anaerolinea sp.]
MRSFNNLGIRAKLLGGFAAVLVLTGGVALFGIRGINAGEQRATTMYEQNVLGTHWANQALVWMVASGREQQTAILNAGNPEKLTGAIKQSREEMAAAQTANKEYHATLVSEGDEQQWAAAEAQIEGVIADREALLKKLEAGDVEGAKAAGAALAPKIAEMNKTVNSAIDDNLKQSKEIAAASTNAARSDRNTLLAMTAASALLGLGAGYFIARQIKGG